MAPIYIDAVLIFGRNANEQRRGRQQRQTGQKQQQVFLAGGQAVQHGQRRNNADRQRNAADHIRSLHSTGLDLAKDHGVEREASRHLHDPGAQGHRQVKVRRYAADVDTLPLQNTRAAQIVDKARAHVEAETDDLARERGHA